jgi:hypothetical protein
MLSFLVTFMLTVSLTRLLLVVPCVNDRPVIATQGLDDLRMFTLANEIQTSIDVYADRATYDAVARRYP